MKISDDMLYQYAAEARDAWLGTFPSDNIISKHKFSRQFERKMRKIISEQRRSPWMNTFLRTAKHAAAVIIIIYFVTFSGLMTVQAYREKFIQIVTQIFEDLTSFHFSSDVNSPDIFKPASFGYLPDGMREIKREQTESRLYVRYESNESSFLSVSQKNVSDDSQINMILDTEDADVSHFILQGEEAFSTSKKGIQTVIFTKDRYVFNIKSNMSVDEIKNVAEHMEIN